ncbi:UvrD-helicase domain-containing protein [Streptomyces sp. TE12347]
MRTGPERVDPPVLDAAQRAVVDHAGGPLLVLAGPGTGKTTTLVEAVAARVEAGTDPARILILTFSRKAAVELRDRAALRLGGARAPQATTFHSFCYGLVRAHQDTDLFADPLRLLSGPEQDVMVRTLLEGQRRIRSIRWPDDLRAALTTRGFADEVRAVLARARELGLGPQALSSFADRIGRPDWKAAAAFLSEYLDVLDMQGTLDYAELLHRAVLLAERTPALASAYDAIFVDEYQDTDASQLRLLRALTGPGGTLVAFGDPDQSIYAFRGADINNILDFESAFPGARVAALTVGRRSGAALLAATRLLTTRMPVPRLPAEAVRAHRNLTPARQGGRVEVFTYPTAGAELDNIADILRRAHLEDGVPWQDMAVLVRAGGRTLPAMRRALISAGVPVETDGADTPLRHEPAVSPLLTALRVAATEAEPATDPVPPTGSAAAATPDAGPSGADPPTPSSPALPTPSRVPATPPKATRPASSLALSGWVGGKHPPPEASPTPSWRARDLTPRARPTRPEASRSEASRSRPPSPCSPPPSAGWTPPTCGGSAGPCGTRSAPPASRCPRPPTSCSPAPSPSRNGSPRTIPPTPAAPSASGCSCARPANCSRAAAPPRRPCGSSGTAPPGRSGWSAAPAAAVRPAVTPTVTSTRSAPSSTPPPAPRNAPVAAARSTSSNSWRRRTSPPTR